MTHILTRGSNAATWASENPVLMARELGVEIDTLKAKWGDGVSAWNALPYAIVPPPNLSLYAPLASPTFTGNPKAPTQDGADNSTSLATTAFVKAAITTGVPQASTTVAGRVELATTAETQTGTDAVRSVTPAGGLATYVSINRRPINLRDVSGIDFTGVANSQAALQAAISAAGVGATIEWGRPGVIRCDSGITMLEHQTLIGAGDFSGSGALTAAALNFPGLTGSQAGITGGGNNFIRDLLIRGPMTGADSTFGFRSPAGSPRFHSVAFVGWAVGASLTDAYYSSFDSCEFLRNKYGLVNTNNYNLGLTNTRFYCQYGPSDSLFGFAIDGGARPLTITGGAIEGYGSGGAINLYTGHALNLFGTYFESNGPSAWGIVASATQTMLTMKGAFVYLTDHNRFIQMASNASNVIDASGNKFVCPTGSTTAPIAYNIGAAVKGSVGPDNWSEVTKVGAVHLNPVPVGIRYMAP